MQITVSLYHHWATYQGPGSCGSLNPSDSAMHVPSWLHIPSDELLAKHLVSEYAARQAQIQIINGLAFPLKLDDIRVLGCPISVQEFCDSLIQSLIGEVQTHLSHLCKFPNLHQSKCIKLATYCCNACVVCLLRAVSVALTIPRMHEFDQMFDNFMAHTLALIHCPHTQTYLFAL
jgi:hypothetical protein